MDYTTQALSAIYLATGVFLGFVISRFAASRVEKSSLGLRLGTETIRSIRDLLLALFSAAGIYAGARALEPPEWVEELVRLGLIVLLIGAATLSTARAGGALVGRYTGAGLNGEVSTSILVTITRVAIVTVGILVILGTLGVSITPALTALGVGGLAVALALQDTLSNLFAGIHVIASKKVKAGDFIAVEGGYEGYVVDVNWRYTAVRQLPNNLIMIPNSKLASSVITNFHRPVREMSFLVEVGVSYGSDLRKVEEVVLDVARLVLRKVPGGKADFEPLVRYHTFDDFSINFTVVLRCLEFVDQYLLKHEFVKSLHERFKEEGVEIPFPIRKVLFDSAPVFR